MASGTPKCLWRALGRGILTRLTTRLTCARILPWWRGPGGCCDCDRGGDAPCGRAPRRPRGVCRPFPGRCGRGEPRRVGPLRHQGTAHHRSSAGKPAGPRRLHGDTHRAPRRHCCRPWRASTVGRSVGRRDRQRCPPGDIGAAHARSQYFETAQRIDGSELPELSGFDHGLPSARGRVIEFDARQTLSGDEAAGGKQPDNPTGDTQHQGAQHPLPKPSTERPNPIQSEIWWTSSSMRALTTSAIRPRVRM